MAYFESGLAIFGLVNLILVAPRACASAMKGSLRHIAAHRNPARTEFAATAAALHAIQHRRTPSPPARHTESNSGFAALSSGRRDVAGYMFSFDDAELVGEV